MERESGPPACRVGGPEFERTCLVSRSPRLIEFVSSSRVPTAHTDEGPPPDLGGAIGWLNSIPLSSKSLRGKVVLVDLSRREGLRESPRDYRKRFASHGPELTKNRDAAGAKARGERPAIPFRQISVPSQPVGEIARWRDLVELR
jgi:hypothetical protein